MSLLNFVLIQMSFLISGFFSLFFLVNLPKGLSVLFIVLGDA